MILTIIGLGLIGGSFSLGLREQGKLQQVIGVDQSPEHAATALSLGLVDEILSLPEACAKADLVLIAVPVDKSKLLASQVLDLVSPHAVVMDMGSTKHAICQHLAQHPRRAQFVAAHPMAGTEYSGPTAAKPDLFQGKRAIICEKAKSSDAALTLAIELFQSLKMQISFMNPQDHDRHAAYISHLSHITSFTLGLAVLEVEKNDACILDMASSGFASTVRLAKSSPEMWRPIFLENKHSILEAMQQYTQQLQQFQQAIETDDAEALDQLMRQANHIRRILD